MQKTITKVTRKTNIRIIPNWVFWTFGLLAIQFWGSHLMAAEPCENIGQTRFDIDVSGTDVGGATVSQLGQDLLVYYYDYNEGSEHFKMVTPEGAVSTFSGTSISPSTNNNSDAILYEGLNNGNIAVIWYSSSSGTGLTDTYFKIIDPTGAEVTPPTIINTLPGSLNRFTRMEQLSNNNMVFTWATGGSDYAMRRFTENGASVDPSQISLTQLAGLSTSQYSYKIAANENGHFMVVIEDYGQHYYGMIFENSSSTPVQVGGNNSFIVADVTSSGHGDKISHIKTLANGQFLVAYQVQTTSGTESRSIAYKIYNDDGTVAVPQTVIRQLYSWGYISEPMVTDNGFYLSYSYNDLGYGPALGYVPYMEYYNNDGTLNAEANDCLPSVIGEWAELTPFQDVDGNISFLVVDTDPGPDYDLWLLRSSNTGPALVEPALNTASNNFAIRFDTGVIEPGSTVILSLEFTKTTNDNRDYIVISGINGGKQLTGLGNAYFDGPGPHTAVFDISGEVGGLDLNNPIIYTSNAWAGYAQANLFYGTMTILSASIEITPPLCENPTAGGTITANQTICSGEIPASLSSETLPTGHEGTIEYKWQQSTTSATEEFADIAESNSASYAPGNLNQPTWYKRLSRVACTETWVDALESNVVSITIEETPVSGQLTKTPDTEIVLAGANVSASLSAGSAGNGADELQYRTLNSIDWTAWTNYASASDINTEGLLQVEIRTRRLADACTPSEYVNASWLVKQAQTVTIEPIDPKTYGAADFEITASASSGLPLSYTSSNPEVATIDGSTITIIGAGQTTIAAEQAGNDAYFAADNSLILQVEKAELTVTADAQTKVYGESIPELTFKYSGFVSGEDASALSALPGISTLLEASSNVGIYTDAIAVSGGEADNYLIQHVAGNMVVTRAPLTLTARDQEKEEGTTFSFTGTEFTTSGLLFSDEVTSATLTSEGALEGATEAGSPYAIEISNAIGTGLENYSISYLNGTMIIFGTTTSEQPAFSEDFEIQVFPNPTSGILNIALNSSAQGEITISLFNVQGQMVLRQVHPSSGPISIDLTGHSKGSYLLQTVINGKYIVKKVILQ
jgi:hypothetical protein